DWSFGQDRRDVEAWFREVGQLQRGNAVKLRGVPIGEVTDIVLDRRSTGVVVHLNINSGVVLPEDPVVILSPESMFGDWQAEIFPRTRFPFYDYAISPEPNVMPGYSLPDISRLTAVGDRIAENLAVITDRIDIAFTEETAVNVRDAIDNIQQVTAQLTRLVEAQEQTVEGLAEGLETTTATFQEAVATANRAFAQVEAAIAEGELEVIMDNVEAMTTKMDSVSEALAFVSRELGGAVVMADSSFTSLNAIMQSLEQGEGTLGMLIQDTALYTDLVLTSSLVQDLLLDFQRNPRKYINLRIF
ncbi:MAG: MlaD family protein, partial [Longimicrobiales bacterium]|nr:MlaD family protein [Longimicrobiales bacterium]